MQHPDFTPQLLRRSVPAAPCRRPCRQRAAFLRRAREQTQRSFPFLSSPLLISSSPPRLASRCQAAVAALVATGGLVWIMLFTSMYIFFKKNLICIEY